MRLFIAIELPEPARARILELCARLRAAGVGGRFVREQNLHLTLRFLGETPPSALPALKRAMDACASGRAPFDVLFDTAGAFPSREGDTLWLGARPCAGLAELHSALERALAEEAGIPPEGRPFEPHITLARAADKAAASLARELLTPIDARCGEVALIRSELLPGGPVYTTLHSARLA